MKKIIILSNFNLNMNAHPEVERLSKSWIFYRINIFMKYTCKSSINQTNQSFDHIIVYDSLSEDTINLALSKYPPLPNNIRFVKKEDLRKEIDNLVKGYDYFYRVRIDADDIFHPTFIQQLHDYNPKPETESLINQKGYIYDIENNRLAHWYYYSPPFFTVIYNVDEYLKGKRHHFPGGHKDAAKLNHEILDKENFIVTVHGKNTETKFSSVFNTGLIEDVEYKNSILKDFKLIN